MNTSAPTTSSCDAGAVAWRDLATAGVGLLVAVIGLISLVITCCIKRDASSTKHSVREGNSRMSALHGLVASLVQAAFSNR